MEFKIGDTVRILEIGQESAHYPDRKRHEGNVGILKRFEQKEGDWYFAEIGGNCFFRVKFQKVEENVRFKVGDTVRIKKGCNFGDTLSQIS